MLMLCRPNKTHPQEGPCGLQSIHLQTGQRDTSCVGGSHVDSMVPRNLFFFEVSWVAGPMLGTEVTKINRMWSLWASRERAAGQWSGQCSDV